MSWKLIPLLPIAWYLVGMISMALGNAFFDSTQSINRIYVRRSYLQSMLGPIVTFFFLLTFAVYLTFHVFKWFNEQWRERTALKEMVRWLNWFICGFRHPPMDPIRPEP